MSILLSLLSLLVLLSFCSTPLNRQAIVKACRWAGFSILALTTFQVTPYAPEFDCRIMEREEIVVKSIQVDSTQTVTDSLQLQYMNVYRFKQKLGFHESRGNYKSTNPWGFKGKYQFGREMIDLFACGVKGHVFLHDSTLQEQAMDLAIDYYIKCIYKYGYDKYVNTQVDGVTVTMEGLMLGMHFSPLYLKNWLETKGRVNRWDANISIKDYIRKFENKGVPVKKTYLQCRML